jgi:biotin carboxylase
MPRLLLLLPATTYRTEAFLNAARRLGVEMTVGSDRAHVLAERHPSGTLALNFRQPAEAAKAVVQFARMHPIDAVVGVDDDTTVLAAVISAALSLPHNSVESVSAARNKHLMRELLSREGLPVPRYALFSLDDDPVAVAQRVTYPCVVKPLILAASRGVIRADDTTQFVGAFRRLEAILRTPDVAARGAAARQVLVEAFVPGREVALEGLLSKGELQMLALFDKPDPLDGPFFEETIYVTPSRLSVDVQREIASCTARAAQALGLQEGPLHAELRFNAHEPWVIEVAARSIGGLCSRTLRFGVGMSLEELILRHAFGIEIESLAREQQPAGVMMIPIRRAGVLREVRGQAEAKSVPGIEEIAITAHLDQDLVPLPEGGSYLGFIFARAETPERVEAVLRKAHRRLEFRITPREATGTT